MVLAVHLIVGHRRLRDLEYHSDDDFIQRVLVPKRLPDLSAVARSLGSSDVRGVGSLHAESKAVVIERSVVEGLASVTVDFDGSVLSTGRHSSATGAVFDKTKKGLRSYYRLFCTVARFD